MKFLFFGIFFFIFLLFIILGNAVPIYKEHLNVTGSIINYDSVMRKFVYKINLSRQQMIDLLSTGNNTDELSVVFDFDKSTMRFSEYGSYLDYHFQIQEYDDFSVLRLQQVALIGMGGGHIPYKLNPFLVSKLHAEILPFSQYGF